MPASVTVAEVNVAFGVGDALDDALVRPGRVVVRLVSGQDCAQVRLAEDQYAVHKLAGDSAGSPASPRRSRPRAAGAENVEFLRGQIEAIPCRTNRWP
jgi:hypothetical protein